MPVPPLHRVFARVMVTLAGCWEWQGYRTKEGYGVIGVGSRTDGTRATKLVHRVVYESLCKPIPEGLLVCHTCDNPSCVNPEHLFVGTNLDNNRDMIAKGRAVTLRGEQIGTHKLTSKEVVEIRKQLETTSYTKLAAKFGVSDSLIQAIGMGTVWKHL